MQDDALSWGNADHGAGVHELQRDIADFTQNTWGVGNLRPQSIGSSRGYRKHLVKLISFMYIKIKLWRGDEKPIVK
jgi:hypothetical protein